MLKWRFSDFTFCFQACMQCLMIFSKCVVLCIFCLMLVMKFHLKFIIFQALIKCFEIICLTLICFQCFFQALTASRGLSQIQSPLTPQVHHKKHSKANKLYLFAFLPPCFLPCFAPAFTVSMRVIKSLLKFSSIVAFTSAHFSISAWLILWASIFPLSYS